MYSYLNNIGVIIALIGLLFNPSAASVLNHSTTNARCFGDIYGALFQCVHGQWTYYGSLNLQHDLIIDGTKLPILITGNVTLQGSANLILKNGSLGLYLHHGCLHIAPQGIIIIDWTSGWPSNPDSWVQEVLKTTSNCAISPPSQILLPKPKSCLRLEYLKKTHTNALIQLHLQTGRSHCQLVLALSIGLSIGAAFVGAVIALLVISRQRKRAAQFKNYASIQSTEMT